MAQAPLLAQDSDARGAAESAGVVLPPSTRITPMLRQWLSAKAKAKDAILLFRMGDFYELFGDDAVQAGPVLDLVVTTRDRDKGEDAMPMAGFPHQAAPQYIAKLIGAGHRVAVCDQLEDPSLAKGIVKRDVTRVVTPGMVLDDESLEQGANNFLVGVVHDGGAWGIAALDVSTGAFLATTAGSDSAFADEVLRLAPREVVCAEVDAAHPALQQVTTPQAGRSSARVEVRPGAAAADLARLRGRFALDPVLSPVALSACVLCLRYAEETTQGALPAHLRSPVPYALGDRLLLDATTRAHLDLHGPPGDRKRDGTLLSILDRTKTAAGARLLLQWLMAPSADLAVILERQEKVAALLAEPGVRASLREVLSGFGDVERLVARACARRSGPRELLRLADALARLPRLAAVLQDTGAGAFTSPLAALLANLDPVVELKDRLSAALVDDAPAVIGSGAACFRAGYDPVHDELMVLSSGGRDQIAALEERERNDTGIASLKIRYTRVFGYTIEVTKAQQSKVPARFKRKQTIATGERFVTDELLALEDQVENAEQRRLAREAELFEGLLDAVIAAAERLLRAAAKVALVDVLQGLAEVAHSERWCVPTLLPFAERCLAIEEGRHPMVEHVVTRGGRGGDGRGSYVPNSVTLDGQDRQVLLITGPNMAGKSTLMRQVALIQVLAQMGSCVPATSATLSLCDRIFTRVGASDDLAGGRSTFMVEMTETGHILAGATPSSLVLLDEIGRGTSTFDGLSIAWAVVEHLHDATGARALFATHYHELTSLSAHLPRLKNAHVVVKEWGDEIVFVRTLQDGAAGRSYGIQVARLAGLPTTVIERARAVLSSLEGDGEITVAPRPPALSASRTAAQPAPQLSLFAPAAPPATPSPVLQRLRSLEVLRMTPLEAMNALAALVDDAKRDPTP